MNTAYDELIEALSIAATPDRSPPPAMRPYLEKVRLHAYKVADRDFDDLKEAFSEDELFEHTVATAVAAGLERLEAALRALE
jgi:alkylhydroperoxidase family enzyme